MRGSFRGHGEIFLTVFGVEQVHSVGIFNGRLELAFYTAEHYHWYIDDDIAICTEISQGLFDTSTTLLCLGRGNVNAEKMLTIELLTSNTLANCTNSRRLYKSSCTVLKEERCESCSSY